MDAYSSTDEYEDIHWLFNDYSGDDENDFTDGDELSDEDELGDEDEDEKNKNWQMGGTKPRKESTREEKSI